MLIGRIQHKCHGVTLHRCNAALDLGSEACYLITKRGFRSGDRTHLSRLRGFYNASFAA
jgi:hypothetical protein